MQCTEIGDLYSYLAYKRDTQFFIGFTVGKWNEETCDEFYKKLASRLRFPTQKRKLTIFTDGNKQNITAIANNFHKDAVRYGLRKKIKIGQKIIGIVSEAIFGNPALDKIGITQIDGFCSKLRERISCYTQKHEVLQNAKLVLKIAWKFSVCNIILWRKSLDKLQQCVKEFHQKYGIGAKFYIQD